MRKCSALISSFLPIVAVVLLMTSAVPAQITDTGDVNVPVNIRVNTAAPLPYKIPRTIFGSFLEPIGNSTYGGLWAEILQNPSFEDGLWNSAHAARMVREHREFERAAELALPLPWEPLYPQQGARYMPKWGDAANSSKSLLIMALPEQEAGVRQGVYLPVHRELKYVGSIYAKPVQGSALVISLRKHNKPEQVLAKAEIKVDGTGWKKYPFALNLQAGQVAPLEQVDFVISTDHEERILVDQASLMPADNIDGLDPEMVAMSRDLKSPIVRFGGNFTSAYDWRDGIGPRDKRVNMMNIAWGIPEYNYFGTDEFLRYCQLIGASPQIAVNLGTGTPDDAAAWVKYVNEHWGDHKGGLLWELGNELWGDWQVGYPTEPRVAERTRAFSEAIRKVDPKVKLIATGADPDVYESWNRTQMTNPPGTFDYLATHFVVTTHGVKLQDASPQFTFASTAALPAGVESRLRLMHDQIQQGPHKDKADLAFTEWLFWTDRGDKAPKFDNMAGGIATGGWLNMLMRNADIVPISDMTGIIEFGGVWKKRERVFGTPAYWVLRAYSNADATRPVSVTNNGPTYTVHNGSTRMPEIDNVPYLDVFAALNDKGDRLTLFCVNRHQTSDLQGAIDLNGFVSASTATASTIKADGLFASNDESNPDAIRPVKSSIAVGRNFTYKFPAASVTLIEIQGRSK